MGWGAVIASVLKIILIGLGALVERNRDIKEAKKEALKDAKQALKDKDISKLTATFDRVRRF